jgi:hypothetical protein
MPAGMDAKNSVGANRSEEAGKNRPIDTRVLSGVGCGEDRQYIDRNVEWERPSLARAAGEEHDPRRVSARAIFHDLLSRSEVDQAMMRSDWLRANDQVAYVA